MAGIIILTIQKEINKKSKIMQDFLLYDFSLRKDFTFDWKKTFEISDIIQLDLLNFLSTAHLVASVADNKIL